MKIFNLKVCLSILFIQTICVQGKPRIIGGGIAPEDEYPWFYSANGCGGSLIAPDIVLSAAHCQPSFIHYKYSLYLHPQYGEHDAYVTNDYMIVKLENPIFDVTPVTLDGIDTFHDYEEGKSLWVMGTLIS